MIRLLAVEPPQVSLAHMALRFPPVTQFLERFRAVLRRRARFDFDQEVGELSRVEQAVAFLALLDLRRSGRDHDRTVRSVRADQDCANRGGEREPDERTSAWTLRSA